MRYGTKKKPTKQYIDILGTNVSYSECNEIDMDQDENGKPLFGYFLLSESEIIICSDQELQSKNRTILHEITHATIELSGHSASFIGVSKEQISDLFGLIYFCVLGHTKLPKNIIKKKIRQRR